ncbi:hypothetical protein ASD21_14065 [Caulobacter sp. Root1455]|uniref:hypothetical protein n=1 Tax=Caulobacter sp. Root1455 TaxID=1736465 RepID=UPI0006F66E61|nr:hypothetical protein [Caulobacter sp. Root1455]KQY92517.1 hypothetical protein ASD21_14065 [Caulobacter sp. Root1455]
MATYTIKILNSSDQTKTYVAFQAPPTGAAVLAGWSVRQTIAAGGAAEVSFTPPAPRTPSLLGKLCALLFRAPPSAAPGRFRLAVDAGDAQVGPHIDFSASPTAPTTIVHGFDGALSVAAATTLGYSSFVTPVGNLAPTLQGDNFVAPFNVVAAFTNSAGGGCANGEYRQLIMGRFSVDGTVVAHRLCESTLMSPDVLREDGCPPPGCSAYGHRACPPTASSRYSPDQATGPQFAMYDQPGFRNMAPGNTYVIDLRFQGSLVDTAAGVTLASHTWTVSGQTVAPRPLMPDEPQGFQSSDRLVGVRQSANLASGVSEVHVLIARRDGSPRLDPTAVKVAVVDAAGQPLAVGEPVVHEVGGQRGTTATIVHRLLPGQAAPAKATLDIDGQVTEMAIAGEPRVSTTYTIQVLNQSGSNKSYVVFQAPATASGGQVPVYTNVWATLENVTDGDWDSFTYTVEDADHEPPRFIVEEGEYAPGQVIVPPKDVNLATVDFTDRSQTAATVTENAEGDFSVAYV